MTMYNARYGYYHYNSTAPRTTIAPKPIATFKAAISDPAGAIVAPAALEEVAAGEVVGAAPVPLLAGPADEPPPLPLPPEFWLETRAASLSSLVNEADTLEAFLQESGVEPVPATKLTAAH